MSTATASEARRHRWHLAAAAVFLLLGVWSFGIEPRWVARRDIDQHIAGWQRPPLKVAVASDWHVTHRALWRVLTPERALAVVAAINAAHPDIVLLPGDFIAKPGEVGKGDATPEEIAAIFGQLRAPLGVYAVLGNHDWKYSAAKVTAAFEAKGIRVLTNDAAEVDAGLWVAGIGDHSTHHSRPREALAKVPAGAMSLVLMHDPASLLELPPVRGLVVAAHTHGGQVSLPFIGALIVPGAAPREWAYGWVEHGGNTAYVTSGVGVSILPVRFNMRPEWVLFTLDGAVG